MRDDANRTVNGLHVLHASRTRKKRTATTGLPVGTIGTRKKWGVNIDPHMDPFTAPLRPSRARTWRSRHAGHPRRAIRCWIGQWTNGNT